MYGSSSYHIPKSPFMFNPVARASSCQTVLVMFEIMVETVFWVIVFFDRKLEKNNSIWTSCEL